MYDEHAADGVPICDGKKSLSPLTENYAHAGRIILAFVFKSKSRGSFGKNIFIGIDL